MNIICVLHVYKHYFYSLPLLIMLNNFSLSTSIQGAKTLWNKSKNMAHGSTNKDSQFKMKRKSISLFIY